MSTSGYKQSENATNNVVSLDEQVRFKCLKIRLSMTVVVRVQCGQFNLLSSKFFCFLGKFVLLLWRPAAVLISEPIVS